MEIPLSPTEVYFNTVEAAEFLRRTPRTMEQWRYLGKGPVYHKDDGSVTYALSDLEEYQRQNRQRGISDLEAKVQRRP